MDLCFSLTSQPVDFVKLHIPTSTKLLLRLLTSFGGVFGFSIMFNSSKKIAASAGCIGAIANTLRLTLVDLSLPAAAAAFIGALAAGLHCLHDQRKYRIS